MRKFLILGALLYMTSVQASVGLFKDLSKTTTSLKFKAATFNIRFYGTGGVMGTPSDNEHRDPALRSFIADQLGDRDVISFEEIVDVARLEANVLPQGWKCVSYDNSDPTHQHVVICARPGLRLEMEPSDDNFIMENVAYEYNRSRPAVHAIVKNNRGQTLARVVAVHLKAMPQFSEVRQRQARVIGQNLADLNNTIPTVITGDFNTFDAPSNGQVGDDEDLLGSIFNSFQSTMTHVPNPFPYTFRSPQYKNRFDHFYTSGFKVNGTLKVYGACNTESTGGEGLNDPPIYYSSISDHCPVAVDLEQNHEELPFSN